MRALSCSIRCLVAAERCHGCAVPPTSVLYANNPVVYTRTLPIAANSPTVTGGGANLNSVTLIRRWHVGLRLVCSPVGLAGWYLFHLELTWPCFAPAGAVTSYTIAPALSAGIVLEPVTGVISGTPTAVRALTVYTVSATNSGGSATVQITITVNDRTSLLLLVARWPPIALLASVRRPLPTC